MRPRARGVGPGPGWAGRASGILHTWPLWDIFGGEHHRPGGCRVAGSPGWPPPGRRQLAGKGGCQPLGRPRAQGALRPFRLGMARGAGWLSPRLGVSAPSRASHGTGSRPGWGPLCRVATIVRRARPGRARMRTRGARPAGARGFSRQPCPCARLLAGAVSVAQVANARPGRPPPCHCGTGVPAPGAVARHLAVHPAGGARALHVPRRCPWHVEPTGPGAAKSIAFEIARPVAGTRSKASGAQPRASARRPAVRRRGRPGRPRDPRIGLRRRPSLSAAATAAGLARLYASNGGRTPRAWQVARGAGRPTRPVIAAVLDSAALPKLLALSRTRRLNQ
mmetsp:Transcript_8964/g.30448  ORF Transcript_8964/g.30448 Transcript_8964/m.30448 type:complete len:336 (+) Transcript_8964:117-1124(+)